MAVAKEKDPFTIPERKLRTLSFCEPTPKHMNDWVSHLPLVNLGESSRQLYHAIIELNQLIVEPDVRVKLLELLRKPIQFVCTALSKHYLNQPLVLSQKARKISRLAMAMQTHLAIGYKIVVSDNAKVSNALAARKARKSSVLAIHRAMTSLTHNIVTSCQLYCPAPEKVWYELHQLFLVADANKLLEIGVDDYANLFLHKTTIADCYKRALMIGCCKPNQMRQYDIRSFYDATEMWGKHVKVGAFGPQANFAVDLAGNSPPIYKDLVKEKPGPLYRGIDFSDLLKLMEQYLVQSKSGQDVFIKGLTIPKSVSKDLIHNLSRCWTSFSERAFNRIPSSKQVSLCVGFSATHYFLSGGVEFETQLRKDDMTADIRPSVNSDANANANSNASSNANYSARDVASANQPVDAWKDAFDAGAVEERIFPTNVTPIDFSFRSTSNDPDDISEFDEQPAFDHYQARLVDSSPNGYCVKWTKDIPAEIKTGEVIGINEGIDHTWSVGVIRWLNQISPEEVLMGVELIAPGAIPCGAKVITHEKRKSDYIRALMLPALSSLNQPASLITPNLPFRDGIKIIVNQYGDITQGTLSNRNAFTANFSLFAFEPDIGVDVNDEDESDDPWPDI